MTRILLFVFCVAALAACGESGAPNSLTAHFNGRINSSAQAVSQTR